MKRDNKKLLSLFLVTDKISNNYFSFFGTILYMFSFGYES